MYRYLQDAPAAGGPVAWFLKVVVWWCGLFGVNDAQTVQMVVAVILAIAFVGLLKAIWWITWIVIASALR